MHEEAHLNQPPSQPPNQPPSQPPSQPPNQPHDQDELKAIREVLVKWQKYCSDWAEAYRRAAQSALAWNSWLVAIGIAFAAITTLLSAIGGGTSLSQWAIVGAVVGALTTAVTGLQKVTFASPEQVKQCHISAAGYESAKRDIESALTSGDLQDLKKQRDTIKTQLISTDSQAPELRTKYSRQARQESPSPHDT